MKWSCSRLDQAVHTGEQDNSSALQHCYDLISLSLLTEDQVPDHIWSGITGQVCVCVCVYMWAGLNVQRD